MTVAENFNEFVQRLRHNQSPSTTRYLGQPTSCQKRTAKCCTWGDGKQQFFPPGLCWHKKRNTMACIPPTSKAPEYVLCVLRNAETQSPLPNVLSFNANETQPLQRGFLSPIDNKIPRKPRNRTGPFGTETTKICLRSQKCRRNLSFFLHVNKMCRKNIEWI